MKIDKSQGDADKCKMVKEALKEIEKHSAPGSYIVANSRARCCSFESLQELKQYKVISVEQLQKFDPPGKNKLLNNLGMYVACCLFVLLRVPLFIYIELNIKKRFGKLASRFVKKFKKLRTL